MDIYTARRIALGAQGFARGIPTKSTLVHLRRAIRDMGLLQLDSVQYVCRSHYLPLFSRVGVYSTATLDRLTYASDEVLETWAHEASLISMEDEPLLRWRKQRSREGQTWGHLHKFACDHPRYVDDVWHEVNERGPLRHNDLSDPRPKKERGFWAGSSSGKLAMEWMFRTGALCARRDPRFQRVFDLAERVIPARIRDRATPGEVDAQRQLLVLAARRHGIGTADCLADYYRIKIREARPLLASLAEEGSLELVEVDGSSEPWFLHPQAAVPRSIRTATVLSPFDPVVWNRKRNSKLFGFDYRIEIYVPEAKRQYGYYVLPFLLDEEIVGRVEVKSERKTGRLLVRGAWLEPGKSAAKCARAVALSLQQLAVHLQLDELSAPRKGNLAAALRKVL